MASAIPTLVKVFFTGQSKEYKLYKELQLLLTIYCYLVAKAHENDSFNILFPNNRTAK